MVNTANEMAVAAFLQKDRVLDIPRVIRQVMDLHQVRKNQIWMLFSADTWARQETQRIIEASCTVSELGVG